MQERPVGILIEALRELGGDIRYLRKEGFPPVEILSFPQQLKNHISVRGDVSSQFTSALLMIAPVLPRGLTLELTGRIGSKPYIDMTLGIMKYYGIKFNDLPSWGNIGVLTSNQIDAIRFQYHFDK